MQIKQLIKKHHLEKAFMEGTFGTEREGLRVLPSGELSLKPHPEKFGSRLYHPYIQTDFSESQLELVTPPAESLPEMMDWLKAVHDVAYRTIAQNELIWPFSMPARLPEEKEIPIADSGDENEVFYRKSLAKRYGRKKQMISGIHFNFMFTEEFFQALLVDCQIEERKAAKEQLILKLARNYQHYQWVLTYLFGASPVEIEKNGQRIEKAAGEQAVRSLRNSSKGYPSGHNVSVSYDSYEAYAKDILSYVDSGELTEEREYYGSVRLRNRGSIKQLVEEGTEYLEFRSFDVNPFSPLGFPEEEVRFIHLFLLLMVWMEENAGPEEIKEGKKKNDTTALEHPTAYSAYKQEAISLLNEMMSMVQDLEAGEASMKLVKEAIQKFEHPELTLSARVLKQVETNTFLKTGLQLAETHKKDAWKTPYQLRGFETMELSTQLLLFDAIQKGLEIKILDKQDQFIELKHGTHREYVKNGNMTSKDTYVSALLMGNKTTTKKVLEEHGYHVPKGQEYSSAEDAKKDFWKIEGKQFVVKPKTTNYGVGISVFKEPASQAAYEEAIDLAFQEDEAIIVENFAHGTEYRFFVLNGKTEAVLLRVAANVVGDGKQTITELVEEKNKDPYRGTNHRSPLELIQLGEIEKLMLKQQGFTIDDIPEKGKVVYLRENSNISTGGDSIDYTNEMHESYKVIAAGIAESMGAKVCGVDLMIDNYKTAGKKESKTYTCLEANYNPAMHMHAYVAKGKGIRLTRKIIEMLFPELKDKKEG